MEKTKKTTSKTPAKKTAAKKTSKENFFSRQTCCTQKDGGKKGDCPEKIRNSQNSKS